MSFLQVFGFLGLFLMAVFSLSKLFFGPSDQATQEKKEVIETCI